MTSVTQGLFLSYVSGAGGVDQPYFFTVSFDGGKTSHELLMDTGSPWVNVGSDLLPEGSYTVVEPQPSYPKPAYSSDGKTYEGQWVYATVTVTGSNRASFTTPKPIIIFRSTNPSTVAMMGVSTRYAELDALNIFLNVPDIVGGSFPPGYILDPYGVRFGYGADTAAQFTRVQVTEELGQRTAAATVTLTGPTGKGLPTYAATLPFLMDTGIDYTIVTPRTRPPAPVPPVPSAWETGDSTGYRFIGDVGVSVVLGSVSWAFNTNDCGKGPAYPAMARLAKPSEYGIVNTGRHFLASYKYLIELSSRIGASTGTMGFLKL